MIRNMKLRTKLIVVFLAVGIIPFAVIGTSSLIKAGGALSAASFDKLEAVQSIKKGQIKDYFETMAAQLRVLKDDPFVKQALLELNAVFEKAGNRVITPEWEALAKTYDPRLKDILKDNGWYDIFLIHTDGDIVYTVAREPDLGMIIPKSPLKDSGLGKAFARAQSLGGAERTGGADENNCRRVDRPCRREHGWQECPKPGGIAGSVDFSQGST